MKINTMKEEGIIKFRDIYEHSRQLENRIKEENKQMEKLQRTESEDKTIKFLEQYKERGFFGIIRKEDLQTLLNYIKKLEKRNKRVNNKIEKKLIQLRQATVEEDNFDMLNNLWWRINNE